MSRVLVLGATGYIGLAVATAFERKSYNVYGTSRSDEKARILLQHEIKPVICKVQEISTWIKVAEQSDVVVEVVSDLEDPNTTKIVSSALVELLKRKPHIAVIYSSGTWVHGDSKRNEAEIVDEHVATDPFGIVAWRPAIENIYTAAGAIVLRPGLVYGKAGSLSSIWFPKIAAGKIAFPATTVAAMVHVEDLAEAYVLAAEQPRARGQIFNIASSVEHVATAFEVTKHHTNPALIVELSTTPAPPSSLAEPMEGTQVVDSAKARVMLRWHPTRRSFIVGLPRYYAAWKAYQH